MYYIILLYINFMKNTKKIFILFLMLFAISIFFVNITNIQAGNLLEEQEGFNGEKPISKTFDETGESVDIRDMIVRIIKVLLTFLGIIATIMIMTAGYKWMTAQGNEDKVSEAKSQIKNAAIGLSLILAAFIITDYIQDCVIDIATGDSSIWNCH